jgi:hypothetical protein
MGKRQGTQSSLQPKTRRCPRISHNVTVDALNAPTICPLAQSVWAAMCNTSIKSDLCNYAFLQCETSKQTTQPPHVTYVWVHIWGRVCRSKAKHISVAAGDKSHNCHKSYNLTAYSRLRLQIRDKDISYQLQGIDRSLIDYLCYDELACHLCYLDRRAYQSDWLYRFISRESENCGTSQPLSSLWRGLRYIMQAPNLFPPFRPTVQ